MHLSEAWTLLVFTNGNPSLSTTTNEKQTLFDVLPDDLQYNSTGWLVYDDSKPKPDAATVDELDSFDDFTLVPFDKEELYGTPDQTVELTVIMDNLDDGGS